VAAEKLGLPAVGVMTERFISAAELMSRVLGLPDYQFAVIGHPISSATDDELRRMAESTMAQGRKMLVQSP
tara:strand:- start:439 stop:651 length:213 start_codon:yes stop_codon:yes gene_type:complete